MPSSPSPFVPALVITLIALSLVFHSSPAAATVSFTSSQLTFPNGTRFFRPALVSAAFSNADPNLLLVATYSPGTLTLLRIARPSLARYHITAVLDRLTLDGGRRSVLDVISDPFSHATFFVATAVYFYDLSTNPAAWQNGAVLVVRIQGSARPKLRVDSQPLISGLPVADGNTASSHGLTVDSIDGALYISQVAHSNGGVPVGNTQENIWAGTILRANVRRPGTRIAIRWSSNNTSLARPVRDSTAGKIGVYATGIQSIFRPVVTLFNNLVAVESAGGTLGGPRSTSCTTDAGDEELNDTSRFLRIRPDRWYGMANRIRGASDPRQCTYVWGDEPNIATLRRRFPSFAPPLYTTKKIREDGLVRSGATGFAQYLANWTPGLRGKFLVSEFDTTEEVDGRPMPKLYAVNLASAKKTKRGFIRGIADTPGVDIKVADSGAIFVAQVVRGSVAIAVPQPRPYMKRQQAIRGVWPDRVRAGQTVRISTTGIEDTTTARINGRVCRQMDDGVDKIFGFITVVKCKVPRMNVYDGKAVTVSVGDTKLARGVVVLDPTIKLVQ